MVNPARMSRTPVPSANAPRVAVIVPAYGVAHLLGEALDSLRAQSYADWECVVVDDGARDDVAGAAAPYLADPRIRLLATDNRQLLEWHVKLDSFLDRTGGFQRRAAPLPAKLCQVGQECSPLRHAEFGECRHSSLRQ